MIKTWTWNIKWYKHMTGTPTCLKGAWSMNEWKWGIFGLPGGTPAWWGSERRPLSECNRSTLCGTLCLDMATFSWCQRCVNFVSTLGLWSPTDCHIYHIYIYQIYIYIYILYKTYYIHNTHIYISHIYMYTHIDR